MIHKKLHSQSHKSFRPILTNPIRTQTLTYQRHCLSVIGERSIEYAEKAQPKNEDTLNYSGEMSEIFEFSEITNRVEAEVKFRSFGKLMNELMDEL